MTSCIIRQQENLTRKVFDVLTNKRRLFAVRNKIRTLIQERVAHKTTPFDELEDDDLSQCAEQLQIAPIELRRVRAAMVMALSEALTVEVLNPDGKTARSFINVSFSGQRISTAFRAYASGQLVRHQHHPAYGDFLTALLQPSHHSFDVCFHMKWEDEDHPTASIYHVTKSTDEWFVQLVAALGSEVLEILNREITNHV